MNRFVYITIVILFSTLTLTAMEQQESLDCTICYETLHDKEQDVITLACSKEHSFHSNCLATWYLRSNYKDCPTCRHPLTSKERSGERVFDLFKSKKKKEPVACEPLRALYYTVRGCLFPC